MIKTASAATHNDDAVYRERSLTRAALRPLLLSDVVMVVIRNVGVVCCRCLEERRRRVIRG